MTERLSHFHTMITSQEEKRLRPQEPWESQKQWQPCSILSLGLDQAHALKKSPESYVEDGGVQRVRGIQVWDEETRRNYWVMQDKAYTQASGENTLKQSAWRERGVPMPLLRAAPKAGHPKVLGNRRPTSRLPLNPSPLRRITSSSGFLLLKSV